MTVEFTVMEKREDGVRFKNRKKYNIRHIFSKYARLIYRVLQQN